MEANTINQTHPGNPINDPHVNTPKRHSTFDLSYVLAQTDRFGELTPHFVMDSVPDDQKITLQSKHSLRTLSLKSPILQDVQIKKDYFAVPLMAILPFQWDRIITNPNLGDDVPSDSFCAVDEFVKKINTYFAGRISSLSSTITSIGQMTAGSTSWVNAQNNVIYTLLDILTEMSYFYSNGSLLNTLGYNMTERVQFVDPTNNQRYLNFDQLYDYFLSLFVDTNIKEFTISNGSKSLNVNFRPFSNSPSDFRRANRRRMIEWLNDNAGCTAISSVTLTGTGNSRYDWSFNFASSFVTSGNVIFNNIDNELPCNLARLWAYQLVCAHFYSNDAVDYVYSAETFRQNVYSLIQSLPGTYSQYFSYNGVNMQYDYMSAHFFNAVLTSPDAGQIARRKGYFSLLFPFRNSLRFVDYFTGSKTRPLAVGNTDVSVNSNLVSVIDVTRSIQMQRFLNAVNRTGRKVANYFRGIFGTNLDTDYHDPLFLAHTSDGCFSEETSNTGSNQLTDANSITSLLKSNANRYAFEMSGDRHTVIIGITYFDIPRLYSHSTDRHFFHSDRFDIFNPFMEYIGDQPVYANEITSFHSSGDPDTFGYQSRYMEYKQRVSRAVGGFVKQLPGFAFLADNVPGLPSPTVVSPDYIRSHPLEFDEFFVSLTGFSLSSYFHFIIVNFNDCHGGRPMSYNPQIL